MNIYQYQKEEKINYMSKSSIEFDEDQNFSFYDKMNPAQSAT